MLRAEEHKLSSPALPTDAAVSLYNSRTFNRKRAVISLAYFSTAAPSQANLDLGSILATSQRNNSVAGVTGLLCHIDGSFLQFLEGDESNVRETYARISQDRRHSELIKVHDAEIAQRAFGQWSMGLVNINQVDTAHQAFCQNLRGIEIAPHAAHREALEGVLGVFRAWLR